LKMAGVRPHPALRILIGAVFLAIGFLRHGTAPLIIGGVLIVWGVVAVLGLSGGESEDTGVPRP
jgi:energy-coupling factor transporter transmembrane protein EcfT